MTSNKIIICMSFAVVNVSFQTSIVMVTEGSDSQTDVCLILDIVDNTQAVVETEILVTGGSATGEIANSGKKVQCVRGYRRSRSACIVN